MNKEKMLRRRAKERVEWRKKQVILLPGARINPDLLDEEKQYRAFRQSVDLGIEKIENFERSEGMKGKVEKVKEEND